MTIQSIYRQFPVPPTLQEHMYRVAALSSLICNSWRGSQLDSQAIISTMLIHDLGNLAKFEISPDSKIKFDDQPAEESCAYWAKQQQLLFQQFGKTPDEATISMVKHLHLKNEAKILELLMIHDLEPLKLELSQSNPNWAGRICAYSDFRVGPFGYVSLTERFSDLVKRYAHRQPFWADTQQVNEYQAVYTQIEDSIQSQIQIDLQLLPTATLQKIAAQLVTFELA